ncbi:MAG: TlpA family protein disulfide reductase [Dehalococcoidia bacterium]|nr:TlpA family protein disulfide reductase [Dehalococcoidia bacterium]
MSDLPVVDERPSEPAADRPPDLDPEVEERPQGRREWQGPLRSLALPLLIVAVIVGGVYYLQNRGGAAPAANPGGFGTVALPAALYPAGTSPSSEVGRVAPDFLLERADGGTLRLSDLRGRPVLVNFWATWCPPCRKEVPEIVKAYTANQAAGFVVVGVDLQENAGATNSFASEFGMKFPIVIDRTGEVGQTWRIGGPIKGIPSSYFIDRQGVVRARFFGPMSAQTIADDIKKIMG